MKWNFEYVRYADDIFIFVKDFDEIENDLNQIAESNSVHKSAYELNINKISLFLMPILI